MFWPADICTATEGAAPVAVPVPQAAATAAGVAIQHTNAPAVGAVPAVPVVAVIVTPSILTALPSILIPVRADRFNVLIRH